MTAFSTLPPPPPPGGPLTNNDAVEIWLLRREGWHQHQIAARFCVNPGRVSDVLKGRLHPGSKHIADVLGNKRP